MNREKFKGVSMGLLVLLLAVMALGCVFAAGASFAVDVVPAKTAFYIGEAVPLTVKISWSGLTQNYSVNVELWNATAVVKTLESSVSIPGASEGNGTLTKNYNVQGLTDKTGSFVYYVKLVEVSTGLAVAQDSFGFSVQSESIVISVAWEDASKDRQVDVSEPVTFTVFISWAFVNESFTGTVYVFDNGIEKVLGTVDFSVGSGSKSLTYLSSYETAGPKTVTFKIVDPEGKTVAVKSVSLVVAGAEKEASWLSFIERHKTLVYALLILLGLIIIALIIKKH